jgi:hypothetical protein
MKELILNHLKTYGNITSFEAITKYRCTRLSHYILLLRKDGHKIIDIREPFTHSITGKKSTYVRYTLQTE